MWAGADGAACGLGALREYDTGAKNRYAVCVPPARCVVRVLAGCGAMAQLVARLHGMQKVRGSNPLSSTIFRVPVRLKRAKLLALDHRLTWANAELRTVAFYAECQGPNLSSPHVMHAQHPYDPDPDPTERSSTRC